MPPSAAFDVLLTAAERFMCFPGQLINCERKCRMSLTPSIDDDRLDATFSALANATRRAILSRLAEGDATVNELADPFDLTLPAISKHIKVLEHAGLVVRGHRAQYRPCALNAAALVEVSSWAEHYRRVWEERFDRMDDRIKQRANRGRTGPNERRNSNRRRGRPGTAV